MDRDSFNFSFPISGDSSSSAPLPLWNFPPIAEPETTLYSDAILHSLLPFPSDFSISDPNIIPSKIPKLEPPLSPSYTHHFAGNLPALRSFESPTPFDSYKLEPHFSPSYTHCYPSNLPALRSFESPTSFDSYFTKLEPLSLSPPYTHRFPQNLPALQSFESPTYFDSYFTNLISGGSDNNQPVVVQDVNIRRNTSRRSGRGSKRKRSQRIGDKYRSLKKLMPLDEKMDTTSMLGEAYKYIKFLQAQVKALENMPEKSGFKSEDGALGSVFGAIGELSRNELLQVVLNSPEVQNMLCSEGRCVFSIEQVLRFKKLLSVIN